MQRPGKRAKAVRAYYPLNEEDAYRIDGLISTLGMAIQEILELSRKRSQPPSPDESICLETYETETLRIRQEWRKAIDSE
jgi:DNA-binding transcriptional MerR regulator